MSEPIRIEIRPESPISTVWRVYEVDGHQMLRDKGRLLGGTLRQAHIDAYTLAVVDGFQYTPPQCALQL